jgi:hypothetical protein
MVPKAETFPPVTMGHIRGHGCRDLLVYCACTPALAHIVQPSATEVPCVRQFSLTARQPCAGGAAVG